MIFYYNKKVATTTKLHKNRTENIGFHRLIGPCDGGCYEIDIEADDIDIEDTVTLIWMIA